MKSNSHKSIILPILFCVFALIATISPSPSYASLEDGKYTMLAPLPCISSNTVDSNGNQVGLTCANGNISDLSKELDFRTYAQYAMNLIIALSAVAAVVMIVIGGFEYMTTTTVNGKGSSIDKMTNALWGLLLILCSYIILKTIDPRLVKIPNTLVDKLALHCPGQPELDPPAGKGLSDPKCLASNTTNFLGRLQTEADNYRQQSISFGNSLQTTINDVRTKQQQYDDLQKQLNDPLTSASLSEEIVTKQQQLLNEINQELADVQVAKAKIAINSAVGTVTSYATSDNNNSPVDVINKINEEVEFGLYNKAKPYINALKKLNVYDSDQQNKISDQIAYTQASLNLIKLETVISSATYWGFINKDKVSIYPTDIILDTPKDSSGNNVSVVKKYTEADKTFAAIPIADARKQLQSYFDEQKAVLSTLKDPTLQNQLNTQLAATQNTINHFVAR